MAGAGYKLFNTGDVLTAAQVNTYLNEQTVMVFASSAARTSALSGVLAEGMVSYLQDTNAVEVYNGSAWVNLAADQTPLTTKGDLFTFSTVDARLAVGNNGETLVADSSTSTGLRYQASQAAGRNYLINGGFDIWQRGTSVAAPSNLSYTTDRWFAYSVSSMAQKIVSRQTGFSGSNYCMRVARNSAQSEVGVIGIGTIIESANVYALQGKTVTLSFDARAGANYSASSGNLQVNVQSGTGVDQGSGTWWSPGWTGNTSLTNGNIVLTTTATKYSVSVTIPSNAAEVIVAFAFTPTGTAGAADHFEVTNVQLEIGSVATTFTRTGGTLAGELAACQRYYYRQTGDATILEPLFGIGMAYSTTNTVFPIKHPITMRVAATSVDFSTLQVTDFVTSTAVTSLTLSSAMNNPTTAAIIPVVASGLTQYRPYELRGANSASAHLGFSAEL